jgi:transcriptional regulator with GAF, ATPase, and Fis domain
MIPARRAAILLVGSTPDEFASAQHWTRDGDDEPFRIPRAVIRRALDDRAALCLNDLLMDDGPIQSETFRQAHVTAAIAVPVLAAETTLGVIYLDASHASTHFTEDDLHLVTALAEASAAPLAQAITLICRTRSPNPRQRCRGQERSFTRPSGKSSDNSSRKRVRALTATSSRPPGDWNCIRTTCIG